LVVKPCLRETTAEERVALIERIAASGAGRERKILGVASPPFARREESYVTGAQPICGKRE